MNITKDNLAWLFSELSLELQRRDVHAQVFVVGGAALALTESTLRATRDVDAVFAPARVVREAAAEVASKLGLDKDWLNDDAKGFMPDLSPEDMTCVFEDEALSVYVPPKSYLLAMKLFGARDKDIDDAVRIWKQIGFTDANEGIELLKASYPDHVLEIKHRYLVYEVAQRAQAQQGNNDDALAQAEAVRDVIAGSVEDALNQPINPAARPAQHGASTPQAAKRKSTPTK